MMRFTRLVCVYMSTFLLEMLYTIHACRTRVVLGCRLYYPLLPRARERETPTATRARPAAPPPAAAARTRRRARSYTRDGLRRRASLDVLVDASLDFTFFPAKH